MAIFWYQFVRSIFGVRKQPSRPMTNENPGFLRVLPPLSFLVKERSIFSRIWTAWNWGNVHLNSWISQDMPFWPRPQIMTIQATPIQHSIRNRWYKCIQVFIFFLIISQEMPWFPTFLSIHAKFTSLRSPQLSRLTASRGLKEKTRLSFELWLENPAPMGHSESKPGATVLANVILDVFDEVMFVCLLACFCLFLCVCLFVCLSVCLSVCLFVCLLCFVPNWIGRNP